MRLEPASRSFRISTVASSDPWSTLEILSAYRLGLCALILGLYFSDYRPPFLGASHPALYELNGFFYLLFTTIVLTLTRAQRPAMPWQALIHIGGDFVALLILVFSSGGVSSGLGMLLITPVAAGSLLLPGRLAIAGAAVASLALLAEETYRQFHPDAQALAYTQAGILGVLLFMIALTGSALAKRARESEALAEQAGADLAKLARLNETIIQKMEAGVLVIDDHGNVQLQNRAARHFLGHENDHRPLPEREPRLWAHLQEWLRNPSKIGDATLGTATGTRIWPQFTRLIQGRGASTLVLLEDSRRIADHAQQIKLAALGRLSASIAHEIRNPLNAIRQAGQLLAESPQLQQQEQDMLQIIDRQTERINKIVKDVLGLSRRHSTPASAIDLADFLAEQRAEFLKISGANTPEIRIAPNKSAIKVATDPTHLAQIFHNLWENSCTHGHADDRPTIIDIESVELADQQRVLIDIRDNGPGVPEAIREQVFEPFFSTDHYGTGLGLYITRELAETNGGHLQCLASHTGSTFRLSLPTASRGVAPRNA